MRGELKLKAGQGSTEFGAALGLSGNRMMENTGLRATPC